MADNELTNQLNHTTAYVPSYFPINFCEQILSQKMLCSIQRELRRKKSTQLSTCNSLSRSNMASSSLSSGLTIGNWCVLFRGFKCGTILLGRLVIFHSSTGLVHFVVLRLFPLDVNMNGWPAQRQTFFFLLLERHFYKILYVACVQFTECWND